MKLKDGNILTGWKEIAKYLGCTVKTAMRLRRDEGLPVKRKGGNVRATRDGVDRWVAR